MRSLGPGRRYGRATSVRYAHFDQDLCMRAVAADHPAAATIARAAVTTTLAVAATTITVASTALAASSLAASSLAASSLACVLSVRLPS